MLHPESSVENINMQELPGEVQQKITKALDDYKSGNYITHEAKTAAMAYHIGAASNSSQRRDQI